MTKDYYGTKRITAWPETRTTAVDPNDPSKGNKTEEGYAVKYADGYISWSPKDVFEEAYQLITAMSFGHAIAAMKEGHKVARQGWNGKDMFLFLVNGSTFKVNRPPLLGIYPEGTEIDYHAHIDMKTANGQIVPWLASQTDMLSNDWAIIVDGPQTEQ